MKCLFARSSRLRRCACQYPVISAAILSSAVILPGAAWADCTGSSTVITCTGDSAAYTNSAANLQVTADATSVIVGPLVIGSGTAAAFGGLPTYATLTVASGANIEGSTAAATVQYGDYAQIVNNGTITSSSGSGAAISVGINSTVTNNGTLTAAAGTAAVSFIAVPNVSTNGTFINGNAAPTAVIGNVNLGFNVGTNVGTFINLFNKTTTATSSATYGLNGNVTGTGNVKIDNEGQWTGTLAQGTVSASVSPTAPSVSFLNGTTANFTGLIQTADATTLINNATGNNLAGVGYAMLLQNGSQLGAASTGSSLTNNGTLTIGSTAAPALVTINGNFTQTGTNPLTGVTPILNMAIAGTGSTTSGPLTAGVSEPYSQIYAIGGTATLSGTLNVNVVAGFVAGSKYDLIVADKGITGNFTTVNVLNASGATLPFVNFQNLGIVTVSGTQQAYEFEVTRNGASAQHPLGSYAAVIGSAGTTNQLVIANSLEPLFAVANTTPTGQEAALVGGIDQLTIPQATALFDAMSPAGLVSYANALRDEANTLERQIQLRMGDQNSDHPEDGWWGAFDAQVDVAGATAATAKQKLFGFNGGFDISGPHHVLGAAASVMFDSLHNEGSTLKGHNRDFAFAGYGGYDLGPIHLTGQVQYNFGHLSTTRTLTLGTVVDTATGKSGEGLFKATATAGFMLKTGSYTFEPFGGIDFDHGHVHGFTETGDGAAALTVLPISANRTDLLAGIALTKSAGKFRPYLRATFRDEIGGNTKDSLVTAYFDGNTATEFTVTGVVAAKHEGDVNAGVNWVFEDAGSLFVGYQGTIRSGYDAHGINAGIRLEF